MSHALTTTREGITGYWVPDDPTLLMNPKPPKGWAYLSEGRRVQMLLGSMASLFEVRPGRRGTDRAAEINFMGQPICTFGPVSISTLKQQLMWVRNYADLRLDRNAEIVAQSLDILSFFGAVAPIQMPGRKLTFEWLTAVQSLCVLVEMQVKHFCWGARPNQLTPMIQPVIPTPDHSTFPSGHATEAFAIATVLEAFSNRSAEDGLRAWTAPYRLAHRIAVNRTIAGVHYPVDSAGGAMLGCAIGEALVKASTPGPTRIAPRHFLPDTFRDDFLPSWLKTHIVSGAAPGRPGRVPLLLESWAAAQAEWQG